MEKCFSKPCLEEIDTHIFISTSLFYNLITNDNLKILVMDVRSDINFEETCIKCKYIINIHPFLVDEGSTIEMFEKAIDEENQELFKKRHKFDLVIIMDGDTNSISYKSSKLFILRTILIEEGIKKYPTLPVVLNGGLKSFRKFKPTFVTEPGQLYKQSFGPFDILFDDIYVPEKALKPVPGYMFESDDSPRTIASTEEQDPLTLKLQKQLEALTLRELDIEKTWKEFSVSQRKVLEGEKVELHKKMIFLRKGLKAVSQQDITDPHYQSVKDRLKNLETQVLKARKDNKEDLELGHKRYPKRKRKLNPVVESDTSSLSPRQCIHKQKLNPDVLKPGPSAESMSNLNVVEADIGDQITRDLSEQLVLEDRHKNQHNPDIVDPDSSAQSTRDISVSIHKQKPVVVEADPSSQSTSDIYKLIQPVIPDRRNKPMNVSVSVIISQLEQKFKFSGYQGLENIRNTCFMNSIIQCLRAIPSVLCFFHNNLDFIKNYPLSYKFGQIILSLWSTNNAARRGLVPQEFYAEICERDLQRTSFGGGRHEDAHDFFLYILSIMKEEVQVPVDPVTTELTEHARDWLRIHDGCTSFFTTEFYHQFEFTTFCTKCNRKVVKYEYGNTVLIPMNDLSQNFRLQDAIDKYLNVDNRFCTICQSSIELKKKLTYYPKVLVVTLLRYEYSIEEKTILRRDNRCMFTDDIIFGGIKYSLKSISMHVGNRDFGHYTALAYHIFSKRWIAYNDSQVYYCDNVHTKGIYKRAYVLFYTLDSKTNINANFFSPPDINKERAEQEKKDQ